MAIPNNSYEMAACFNDPQSYFAAAFDKRNIEQFENALTQGANAEFIDKTSNLSVFDMACQTPGSKDFIKMCLEHGCDANWENPELEKRAIDFCVESLDVENLSTLLQFNPDVNSLFEGLSPIHQLCKYLKDDNFSNTFDCIKILLKYGADINIGDKKNVTPILVLAKSRVPGAEEIMKYLFENGQPDIDTYRDGEARKLISKKFPNMQLPPISNNENHVIDQDYLSTLLIERKEDIFLTEFENIMNANAPDKDNNHNSILYGNSGKGCLLQIAVEKGLLKAVMSIISKGGLSLNAKLSTHHHSPIELACMHGSHEILQFLLQQPDVVLNGEKPLLSIVVKKIGDDHGNHCDYNRCFEILMKNSKIDVNAIDSNKCTALHYAVLYKNEEVIKKLLKKGAYIGTKNLFSDYPIADINPAILEQHFDSCIQTNEQRPGDINYEIIFDYTSLVPPAARPQPKTTKNTSTLSRALAAHCEEMQPIDFISKSPELRNLVKHPLITSFLWLKWQRLGLIFYTNFVLYAIFCISLILYLVFCYGHDTTKLISTILYSISLIGIIYVSLREIIQFLMLSFNYFKQFENYIELALIGGAITVLFADEFEPNNRRMLSAVTILLVSSEFLLLIGSLPVMSISTHMVMLKTVSVSFMRSLILYSIIIISFALCFYTLLGDEGKSPSPNDKVNDQNNGTEASDTNGDDSFNKFNDPWTALVKTIVMFTGEFDAADINFGHNKTTYFIFVLFVFFISIVLLNLLNGLAVSDTASIKSEAELTGYIYRVHQLSQYEKMMLGRTQSDCSNFIFRNWLVKTFSGNLVSIFPHCLPYYKLSVEPNLNGKTNKLIFPFEADINSSTSSYQPLLNRECTRMQLTPPGKPVCCNFFTNKCSRMDRKSIKNAQKVLDRARKIHIKEKENNTLIEKINQMDEKIDKMYKLLQVVANQTK